MGQKSQKGWVYIISNSAIPGLLKIGYTMKDPEGRARELASTGVPRKFNVDYEILLDDPMKVEKHAHKILELKNDSKEWFKCTHLEAIDVIRTAAKGKEIYFERNSFNENLANMSHEFEFAKKTFELIYSNCLEGASRSNARAKLNDTHGTFVAREFRHKIFGWDSGWLSDEELKKLNSTLNKLRSIIINPNASLSLKIEIIRVVLEIQPDPIPFGEITGIVDIQVYDDIMLHPELPDEFREYVLRNMEMMNAESTKRFSMYENRKLSNPITSFGNYNRAIQHYSKLSELLNNMIVKYSAQRPLTTPQS